MTDAGERGDESALPFDIHLPAGRDTEVLEIAHAEAQRAHDNQLQLLADIDDKAMRTVRITLLTLGVFLSAATFEGAAKFINAVTVLGAASLVASILTGLLTYSASNPDLGMGASYLQDARKEAYTKEEWLEVVLAGYEEWCSDVDELNRGEERWLSVSQFCLGLGILGLSVGVFAGFVGWLQPI